MAASVPGWEPCATRPTPSSVTRPPTCPAISTNSKSGPRNWGAIVHYAVDAAEHNRIVLDIMRAKNALLLAKSKSMLTEECALNAFLEARGIEVVDTDLGERIVQFAGERPSHIVLPAIHKKKEEVGELFHRYARDAGGRLGPHGARRAAARAHLGKSSWRRRSASRA